MIGRVFGYFNGIVFHIFSRRGYEFIKKKLASYSCDARIIYCNVLYKMVLENVVHVLQCNCYRTLLEFIIKSNNYKLHTYIHYNYSTEVMKKKIQLLEEYCKIEIDIECIFLFLLTSKTKYIFQTLTVNYIIYKTHKSTTSNLNIKIVIPVVT